MEKEDSLNYTVLCLRHAQSSWNRFAADQKKARQDPYKVMKNNSYKPFHISKDPCLTKKGVSQAMSLADSISKILPKIELILLSPCQRTHLTLFHALKESLDRGLVSKAQIPKIKCSPFVMPAIKGMMDLPLRLDESEQLFKEIAEVDYEEITQFKDRDTWVFDFLNSFSRKKLEQQHLEYCKNAYINKGVKGLFDSLFKMRPDLLDSNEMRNRRTRKFEKYLAERYPHLNDKKILIVSHGVFIKKFGDFNGVPRNGEIVQISFSAKVKK